MGMKRSRDDTQQAESLDIERSIAIANYLLMLSQDGAVTASESASVKGGRVFECKTCNRQFPSFQALGGHRASHKKPRLSPSYDHHDHDQTVERAASPVKAKTHECSICGLEFAVGQALGGHMRRHRAALTGSQLPQHPLPFVGLTLSTNNSAPNHNYNDLISYGLGIKKHKYGGEDTRLFSLDLNLTPLENGLLELKTVSPIFS